MSTSPNMLRKTNGTHSSHAFQSLRYARSRHLTEQMVALLGLTRMLNSTRRLEQQLTLLLRETAGILQVEDAAFYLWDGRSPQVQVHFLEYGHLQQAEQDINNHLAAYVVQTGKVVNVADTVTETRYQGRIHTGSGKSARSLLMVPIVNHSGRNCGCLQVINKLTAPFDAQDTRYLMILADLISVAIQKSLTQEGAEKYKSLEKDIHRAIEIQRQLLPRSVPHVSGYDIFAYNRPSSSVGGDYYDFFPFPRTTSVVMADVAGKGVSAALLTANLHASLHAFANEVISCREVVRKINTHFYLYTAPEMFATFFWGNLNHDTHQFRYVNAGHVPPLLIRADGRIESLKSGGLPIGVVNSFDHREAEITLAPGDTLVICSDGVTEAAGRGGELFGKRRFAEILKQHSFQTAQEIGKAILADISSFSGQSQFADDLTLMILKRCKS